MSTLAEIEAAVESLPRPEQEVLYAHLTMRLETSSVPRDSRLAALDSLQAHLGLDARKSVEWQAAVREARR